jgi:phosphatidate cytidylyltransferase
VTLPTELIPCLYALLLLLGIASGIVSLPFARNISGLRAQVWMWWPLLTLGFSAIATNPFGIWLLLGVVLTISIGELFFQANSGNHLQLLLCAVVALLFACACVLKLTQTSRAQALLFWLFSTCALNDVAQYIVGKTLGRTRMSVHSPNKTWEGFAGGVLVSILLSVLFSWHFKLFNSALAALLGLTLGALGTLGDLLFSYVKRELQIKDFSKLLPGHGGVLDRVDSMTFSAPIMLAFAVVFEGHV